MRNGPLFQTLTVIIAIAMILSMVGPAAGAAVASNEAIGESQDRLQSSSQLTYSYNDTIEVDDNLTVWERAAARPATVDRSSGTTAVDVPTAELIRNDGELATVSTGQEVVFDQGDTVTFDFRTVSGANTNQFANEDFRVLVAQVDTDRDLAEAFLDAQNVSVDDALDAFEGVDGYDDFEAEVESQDQVTFELVREFFEGTEEFEQFAENVEQDQEISTSRLVDTLTSDEFLDIVSFEAVDPTQIEGIDASGAASATYTLDQAGPYRLMGHVGGDVIEPGDERPVFNNTTVVGVDAVTAQAAVSDISTPDAVEHGTNVTVDAESNLGATNVSHAAVVFDEATFSDQEVETKLTAEVSRDLRTEDVIVRSSIAELQGVANIQPNSQIRGNTLAADRFAGVRNLEEDADTFFSIRNALIDGFGIRDQAGDAAQYESSLGDTTLNASVTAIGNVSNEEAINVETLEAWEPGEYTVVHIATDEDTGEISTSRDTLSITDEAPDDDDETDDGDGTDGGDGGDGRDRSDDDTDDGDPVGGAPGGVGGEDPSEDDTVVEVVERAGGASVAVRNVRANTPTEVNTGDGVSRGGATVRGFRVNVTRDLPELNIDVNTSDAPPANIPAPGTGTPVTYIDVDAGNLTDEDYNSVEWDFTVSQSRLDELDSSPDAVQLERYNETSQEWETFETAHQGGNEFTATVPGFSTFAITAGQVDDGTGDDGSDGGTGDDGSDGTQDGGDGGDGEDDGPPVGVAVLLLVVALAVAITIGIYQSQQE